MPPKFSYAGAMTSPFADFTYDARSYDLVRFRDDATDHRIASTLSSVIASDDVETTRRALDEGDVDLLITFARRRIVTARRNQSAAAIGEALDAYALLPSIGDGEMATWFKGALLEARENAANFDALHERFTSIAPAGSQSSADVVFGSLDRLEHLAQCHLVETHTSYGTGFLQTVVVRDIDATSHSMLGSSGLVGAPGRLAPYVVGYDIASSIANVAAALADGFDRLEGHETTALRHDQLIAATFDIVTSGSFLPARACVSFQVAVLEGLSFTATVADVDPEHTGYSAEALADMADDLVDQAAFATESTLVVLSVVPDFDELFADIDEEESDEEFGEEEYDDDPLAPYLDVVRATVGAAQ